MALTQHIRRCTRVCAKELDCHVELRSHHRLGTELPNITCLMGYFGSRVGEWRKCAKPSASSPLGVAFAPGAIAEAGAVPTVEPDAILAPGAGDPGRAPAIASELHRR